MFDAMTFLEELYAQHLEPSRAVAPADLSEYWREMYEERAAIREYEGGQAREHAEAEALAEVVTAMDRREAK